MTVNERPRRKDPMILNRDKARARGIAARKKGHDKSYNPYSHNVLSAAWNEGFDSE